MRTVIVETYNPEWKKWYQDLYELFSLVVKDHCESIEHVGSTLNDIDAYVEGKTEFILGILEQYDFNAKSLEEIEEVNMQK